MYDYNTYSTRQPTYHDPHLDRWDWFIHCSLIAWSTVDHAAPTDTYSIYHSYVLLSCWIIGGGVLGQVHRHLWNQSIAQPLTRRKPIPWSFFFPCHMKKWRFPAWCQIIMPDTMPQCHPMRKTSVMNRIRGSSSIDDSFHIIFFVVISEKCFPSKYIKQSS